MIRYKPSGTIIIGGRSFRTSAPVVNWRDAPYWDATREVCQVTQSDPPSQIAKCVRGVPYGKLPQGPYTRRYSLRPRLRQLGMNPSYDAVKAAVRQFVIHHDGCMSADMCFSVLHNERGLSVHFLLDNDGTIFQTIDLGLMAYHAAEWNADSIGIEMCNRGDAKTYPGLYQSGPHKRDVKACRINGHAILAYDYTKAQYESFALLGRELRRLLPNIPAEFPQSLPGKQQWMTLPRQASTRFAGYIGHYHLWDQKWDPGPFEFEPFCRRLRGSFCYPVFPRGQAKTKEENPEIPEDASELKDDAAELYKANEARADGGFFPVGPWGEARLWHGGIHLPGSDGSPVFAPFPGRLVAARFGKNSSIGSNNFVLLRHDMNLGSSRVQFFSLYMHLGNELAAADRVPWLAKSEVWKAKGKAGDVVLLDEPIEAGSRIGRVGRAGPGELSKAQIHVEMFSAAELFTGMPGASVWTVVDGTAGGRFCDAKQINDIIDTDKDGTLSKPELAAFFSSGSSAQLHYLVTLHVSEWTAEPSWSEALRVPKDFRKWKPSEIDELVADQIAPGLWWDERVAAHCHLPADGIVYHYHPVTLLAWFNQQLLDAAASAAPDAPDISDTRAVPAGITDDFGDTDGTTMRSATEDTEDPCNQKLTLSDLVQGFDAKDCAP